MQRPASRQGSSGAARPSNSVTAEELARAAELEAAILAEEQVASEAQRSREKPRRQVEGGAIYSSVPLATRAAEEYAYVRRDIRRIAILGGSLLAILAGLDILVNVLHVV
jgi:hypothetical protein